MESRICFHRKHGDGALDIVHIHAHLGWDAIPLKISSQDWVGNAWADKHAKTAARKHRLSLLSRTNYFALFGAMNRLLDSSARMVMARPEERIIYIYIYIYISIALKQNKTLMFRG